NAHVSLLTKGLEDLKTQATGVEKQFGLVTERINAEGKNAALRSSQDFKAVQERISSLEALVKKIGDENEATRKATADYAKKVSTLESQIERNQKRFAENSQYTVWIRFEPEQKTLAQEAQNVLANVGFKATLTELKTETAEASAGDRAKDNSLGYFAQDETKAQEILALIKPIIKDVRSVKLSSSPTTFPFKSKIPLEILGWGHGNSFFLNLRS